MLVVAGLALAVGLLVVFSGALTRSTDIESRAEAARAEVELSQQQLEETQAEQEFIKTQEFILWQARVNGYGEPDETRFGLPDDAPSPAPIVPIGPQDEDAPMAPFDAWMELLFGA